MRKQTLGILLIVIAVIFAGGFIIDAVHANYEYSNEYSSYWTLADKASTITLKSTYIDQFVSALGSSGLQGTHDAIWFPTADNSFDSNFQTLQSLQSRLHTISTMDEGSIQYQTAIQQITAQEQDEATDMLAVFEDCWYKVHHYWLWNGWLNAVEIILPIGLVIWGCVLINADIEEKRKADRGW